jgi:hypothetical protein
MFTLRTVVPPCVAGRCASQAFITYSADIRQILDHNGGEPESPRITHVLGPLLWDGCDVPMGNGVELEPDCDEASQRVQDFEADQRISWAGMATAVLSPLRGRAVTGLSHNESDR